MTITIKEAVDLIYTQGGNLFSVKFVKKDGTLRHMTARLGVKKHWTTPDGSGGKYKPSDYGLICVFDFSKQSYRSINTATLREVTAEGVTYQVSP